jgi:hypothetical protein
MTGVSLLDERAGGGGREFEGLPQQKTFKLPWLVREPKMKR